MKSEAPIPILNILPVDEKRGGSEKTIPALSIKSKMAADVIRDVVQCDDIDTKPKKKSKLARNFALFVEDLADDLLDPKTYIRSFGGLAVRSMVLAATLGTVETKSLKEYTLTFGQRRRADKRHAREFTYRGGGIVDRMLTPDQDHTYNRLDSYGTRYMKKPSDIGVPLRADSHRLDGSETDDVYKTKQMMNDLVSRYKHSPAALSVMAQILGLKLNNKDNKDEIIANPNADNLSGNGLDNANYLVSILKKSIHEDWSDRRMDKKIKHISAVMSKESAHGAYRQSELDALNEEKNTKDNLRISSKSLWESLSINLDSILTTTDDSMRGGVFTGRDGGKYRIQQTLKNASEIPLKKLMKTVNTQDGIALKPYTLRVNDILIEMRLVGDGASQIGELIGYIDGETGGLLVA